MIVAGFGFRRAATLASLRDALRRAAARRPPALLATAEDKVVAEAFSALASDLGLPARGIDRDTLAAQRTRTRSSASIAARGTGSVAEAAALAAAGPGARLLGARRVSADGMATCALAEGESP